jgi:formylmethanofuran dehydrogenase subunit C
MSGMRNGLIMVDGSAGLEVGMRMRRGTIVVGGPTRDFTGLQMKGGTIVLRSGAEIRTGAWMQRGTIISLRPLQLMPTFTYATTLSPGFLPLLTHYLAPHGIALPRGPYQLYRGDRAVPGKGEILVLA